MVLVMSAPRAAARKSQAMAQRSSCSGVLNPCTKAAMTPAAAGVIAAFVHGFKTPLHDERWAMAWLFLAAALGALMTSTIRYYSFKDVPWTRRQPSLAIVLLCLFVAVVWKYSEVVLV